MSNSSSSTSSSSHDNMDCQYNCPFTKVCGDCTDCSNRNNCYDFPNDMVSDKCTQCFSCED